MGPDVYVMYSDSRSDKAIHAVRAASLAEAVSKFVEFLKPSITFNEIWSSVNTEMGCGWAYGYIYIGSKKLAENHWCCTVCSGAYRLMIESYSELTSKSQRDPRGGYQGKHEKVNPQEINESVKAITPLPDELSLTYGTPNKELIKLTLGQISSSELSEATKSRIRVSLRDEDYRAASAFLYELACTDPKVSNGLREQVIQIARSVAIVGKDTQWATLIENQLSGSVA